MNPRTRRLLKKRRRYARTLVPTGLVNAIAGSARARILAHFNGPRFWFYDDILYGFPPKTDTFASVARASGTPWTEP